MGKDQKLAAYLDGTSNAYAITREEGAQLVDEVYNMVQLNGEAMGLPEVQQQQAVAMLSTLAALLSGEDLDAVLASLGLSPDLMETMSQLYEGKPDEPGGDGGAEPAYQRKGAAHHRRGSGGAHL